MTFQPGDWVIYTKLKHSQRPGPRAREIDPAPKGEGYTYLVDKFWIVAEVREDGKLLLRTRRGKEHLADADDPQIREASLWERLIWRKRFPTLSEDQS